MQLYESERLSTDLKESCRFLGEEGMVSAKALGQAKPLRLKKNQKPVWPEQRAEGRTVGGEVRQVSRDSSCQRP